MTNKLSRFVITLAVVCLAMSCAVAQNGWKIIDESGEITLVSNGRLKQSWGEDALIMDGRRNQILFLSAEKKAYATGTPEEYCALMKETQEAMMAKLPSDQRSMIEGMRGDTNEHKAQKVAVKSLGPGGMVSGLATEKYAVSVDGELYEEVWLATDPDFLKQFKPLVSIFRGFSECVGSMSLKDDVETSKEYLDLYEKGIEVKARRAGAEGEGETGHEAHVERVRVADSEFAVPAGYTKMELRAFVSAQMGGMDDK